MASRRSMLGGSAHHQRLEAVADLTTLPSISDDIIVACLRERFMMDNIYTHVGPSALVALNPQKYVSSNSDQVLHKYAAEYRDTSEHKEPLGPHVFQLANNAYYHMKRTTQDQTIIITGETGSGKSESRRLAIKSILELSVSTPGKKGSKLLQQIPASEFVLESFGNARTLFNPNASRYGKYTELQFNERGRLSGIKTLDYYLERNRVAGAPSGERNFHIFYYLVAGATPEERAHLHLHDKATYRYLGSRGFPSRNAGAIGMANGRDDDQLRFDQLKVALKTIGLSKRHVAQTCQLLAAILHLGNLEFTIDRGRNEDAAVIRNLEILGIVAEFLGVPASELEATFSYKTKLVKKELCTVFLDPDGASDNRDDLAKTLYSLLFAWLNEHINQKLCKDDFSTFIGLLDFPGSQNLTSRPNSLDQFIVNFANERLLHFTQQQMFEQPFGEYTAEGLSPGLVQKTPYFENVECVRMMQHRPGGLVHIMDDQARRMGRGSAKTDQTMVEAFGKRWGNHSSFKAGSTDRDGSVAFTISHFNGPVTYSSRGFLEKNLDAVNPDFVSLLRGVDGLQPGTEGAGSANPFVKGLFSKKAIATQAHPRNEETIVAAQQNMKPMRAPSTRRKNTIKRSGTLGRGIGVANVTIEEDEREDKDEGAEAQAAINSTSPCVAGEFKAALDTLFDTLTETQTWYIFCISPNDSQLPNQLEGRSVKGQVRGVGLPEVVKRVGVVGANMWEVSLTEEEFIERYGEALGERGVVGTPAERIEQARTTWGLGDRDVVKGLHKVFLSQAAFHAFEDLLRAKDVEETKRSRLADEGRAGGADPYAPYLSPGAEYPRSPGAPASPYNEGYGFEGSNQALPLVANASPFQRADLYDEDDLGSDFDARSRFTGSRREDTDRDDMVSAYGSESYAPSRNMFGGAAHAEAKRGLLGGDKEAALAGEIQEGDTTEVLKESPARRKWVTLCWLLTFWVPSPLLTYVGRMKRMDVRQAWREKLALNILIWTACASTIFVITVLGTLICPTEHVFNTSELAGHNSVNQPNNVLVAVRGEVFDLTTIAQIHSRTVNVVPTKSILAYGGTVADALFPVQVSALCNGIDGNVSPYVVLDSRNITDPNAQYHDFRAFTNDSRPDWYFESMVLMRYKARVGFVGYTPKEIQNQAATGHNLAIYNGLIYDLTNYINSPPSVRAPAGMAVPGNTNIQFMDQSVIDLFRYNAGTDITKELDALNIDPTILARQKICLRNLFTIGRVDNRNSTQCQFSTYLLLALSIVMITVIGFKFLASVSFASARAPEDHDKFVICQVPCYTEGDASLRKTIDSLAQLKYDDKRKLLLIICDGMIVGSGNDRPTPRIVLDILGADPNIDPEPLSFLSLGEGAKQHNMGKVYSGLYECSGHVVPYLVIAKVGKPTERSRPGNRGKRDTQMLVMHFLNKVHFNAPMNPLELEMYHQIKNVIGVNPTFYEYLFMVDADTTVEPHSVNRLISAMIHDKKLLGVCGETELANAKQSIITMMQVYEYFISHHMAKAFESLFGSVTCLPGCFTLYRLRTPDTHKPLLISNQIVEDYSENRVDTLHTKNLLHLGEDRYLTTLLLKHFPLYKTRFVRDAHAYTVAPDDWKVLLSQRRRWINSTVHNLGELLFLDQLCGFCCFSMRFIVMIDLVSTITQPITVVYIGWLIYQVVAQGKPIPTLALALIGVIYGLQALVFVLRRKWDMIAWMVFYILAIPAFSFFLPLYSFWRMDDFSWGQTRIVLGESGKKIVVHDEGKFDTRSIPLKSWNDYENELWDKESNHSIGSWIPPKKEFEGSQTASIYGRETYYDHRPFSPAPSQAGMFPPPGYQSGRNTPLSNYGGGMPQPTRAVTNYLDVPIPGDNHSQAPGSPNDAEIDRAVQDILRSADLNSITKREIRRRLEDEFGMDLTAKKASINAAIDRALTN